MYAHIAAIPVEEIAFAFAPVAAMGLAGLATAPTRLARFLGSRLMFRPGGDGR
jgi:hypothetical protein